MNKVSVISIGLLIVFQVEAKDIPCDNPEYAQFLESLNCQSVLTDATSLVGKFQGALESMSPIRSTDQETLQQFVNELERQEDLIGHCLVKHTDDMNMESLRDIYIASTFAVLSLQRWIGNRPDDSFFENRARSKLDTLQELLDTDMHNHGFNRTPESSGPAKPGELGGGAG